MPIINLCQQNSWYNYGTVSPNNCVINVVGYTGPSSSLVSYPLSTGSNTWFDISGSNNNVQLYSSYQFTGLEKAFGFTGSSTTGGYSLSSDLSSYIRQSGNSQTQEVWIKNIYFTSTGQGVVLSEQGFPTPNTSWYYSQIEIVGNTGYIGMFTPSGLVKLPVGLFNNQLWHHVGWRYSNTGLFSSFYDGNLVASQVTTRSVPMDSGYGLYEVLSSSCPTNMGNGKYYSGLIGAYRTYNRDLSLEEIAQNYTYEKNFYFTPSFSAFFTPTQYFSVPASTDWTVGTGDITVEWWQNLGGAGSLYPRIFTIGTYGNASLAATIEGTSFNVFVQGVPNRLGITISNFLNTWVHFAIVRRSGTLTAYQNGTSIGSVANSNSISDSTKQLNIGYGGEANTSYNGYISQFRWTNAAVYSGNFPKPTSILQPLPQTKLLLLFSSASNLLVDSSGTGKIVTNNSGVTWNSSKPF